MVSFPTLGKIGRLGNHLFQIAATMGLALDHGVRSHFPRWQHEKDFPNAEGFVDEIPTGPQYVEPHFHYAPIPFRHDLQLSGFFQSELYFKRHEGKVRRALTPRGISERLADTASVHVRRGDYLKLPDHHPILPMHYYRQAMDLCRGLGVRRFLVFSDELPWCRENFPKHHDTIVIPDLPPVAQLALTISCGHHILANSTFSWWGAWLDPDSDKTVIAPSLWFGPGYAHYSTRTLFPPEWVLL